MSTSDTAALSGLKVVDLTRVLGGPYATQVLADHGAEVVKVEPPGGDETRHWGPPFRDGTASYFLGVNRSKRSIALDLKTPEGRKVLMRLLGDADVLIENLKTGTMERWGLGYHETLAAAFPRLIYCRISGFGADGPYGGFPGYDAILQAMTGLMSVNGDERSAPLRLGVPIVDIGCGLFSVIAILMALHERERSGAGQFVDMALFDSGLALMHPHAANYFLERAPRPSGNAHPNISPYDKFKTRTCEVFLGVGNNPAFERLCRRLGLDQVIDDPRFRTNADRVQHREALRVILEDALAEHDGEQIAIGLLQEGVPAGPVLDTGQALSQPQTAVRHMRMAADGYQGVASPIKLERTPGRGSPSVPPGLGEHSRALLEEHGYTTEEIDALLEHGIVQATPDN